MTKWVVTIVCLMGVGVSMARADLEPGSWAPDIEAEEWVNTDEPVSLYECRGMIVVLFFWVSWNPGGEYLIPYMNSVNAQYGRQRGVYTIGLTDADLKRVDELLEDERVQFPVGAGSESYEDYRITDPPRVVVIDPQGKIAWTGWPGGDGQTSLLNEIGNVYERTPPTRTHPLEAEEAYRNLADARLALGKENYEAANKAAEAALRHALTGDPLRTRCQQMVDLVEAIGRDHYADAIAAIEDERYGDAVTTFRMIIRDFRGSEVARDAGRRLRTLTKEHEEVADLREERRAAKLAENALYDALNLFRDREFGVAYEKLQAIVEDYADTPAAEKAATVISRIEARPTIMDYVRDYLAAPDCRTWLSHARTYTESGRRNKARELYQRVIDQHPDTKWADQAREALARMR